MKIYKCPECLKTFDLIVNANRHIKKTGCNERKNLTIDDFYTKRQISEIAAIILDPILKHA